MIELEENWITDFCKAWRNGRPGLDCKVTCEAAVETLRLLVLPNQLVNILYDPIKQLHHTTERHGCLGKCKLDNSNFVSTLPRLKHKKRVIIGHFTAKPQKRTNGNKGSLYLEDESGSIPCKVLGDLVENVFDTLDCWVVVSCWNLQHCRRAGWYVELCGELTCLSQGEVERHSCKHATPIDAVAMETALTLLHHRSGHRSLSVNIVSTVRAVSEIFRIKQVSMFLVQLHDGLNVVFKSDQLLFYHDLIQPHREYVFTNLRPSSLKQGPSTNYRVYTASDRTTVLLKDCCKVRTLEPEEWLERRGIMTNLPISICDLPENTWHLISYKGRITAVLDSDLGVYELDNKAVRLHVSCIPASHKFSHLREGTIITVYNAHHKTLAQLPKLVLYCCMASCVQVMEFSPLDSETVPFVAPPVLQNMLYLVGVNTAQLDWLFHTHSVLLAQFRGSHIPRLEDEILSVLLDDPSLSWSRDKQIQRSLLTEFLHPEHHCCHDDNELQNSEMPVYCTIKDVISECRLLQTADTSHYWQHQTTFISQKIVLGVLCLCPVTGRPKLKDATGEIDICVACCHDSSNHDNHRDTSCRNIKQGKQFPCSSLQSCCLEKIVAVRNFRLVQELFSVGDNRETMTTRLVHYLQFCLCDCVCIHGLSSPNNKSSIIREKTPDTDNIGLTEIVAEATKENEQGHNTLDTLTNEVIILVHHKEGLVLDNRRPVSSTGQGCQFVVSAVIHNSPVYKSEVSLVFQREAVKWFPVLYPGAVYRLTSDCPVVKRPDVISAKVDLVIQRSKAKQSLMIDPGVKVERLFEIDNLGPFAISQPHLASVADVVSQCFEGKKTNLKGIIMSRTHTERDIFSCQKPSANFQQCLDGEQHISTLDDRVATVTVRDVDRTETIQIYMKLENTGYPLGVLPGAMVHWYQLDRKMSRLGNIYCQYTSLSMLNVISTQHGSSLNPSSTRDGLYSVPDVNGPVPKRHLVEFWRQPGIYGGMFDCHGNVLQVVRLSLKCVCATCGGVMTTTCGNPGCANNTAANFVSKASLILSDGTASARVVMSGQTVQCLLQLSDDEWSSLEEEVKKHGEIFIKQNGGVYDTSVERFISLLCQCSQIKQTRVFRLKPYTSQQSAILDFNNMEIKDFPEVTLTTGSGSLSTHCVPLLQLECIAILPTDTLQWCHHYSSQILGTLTETSLVK